MRGNVFKGYPCEALINFSTSLRPNACFLPVAAPPLKVFDGPASFSESTSNKSTCALYVFTTVDLEEGLRRNVEVVARWVEENWLRLNF